jgi:hypothetical protein
MILGAISEVRGPQRLESPREIEDAASCSEIEHPKRPCYREPAPVRDRGAGAVVHKYEIGVDGECKRNCRPLPLIQSHFRRIIALVVGIRSNLDPIRELCDPRSHHCRCFRMCKLAVYRGRDESPVEQPREYRRRQAACVSKSKPFQIAALALQIIETIRLEYAMRFQEPV